MILNGECGVFNPLLVECLVENQQLIREEMQVNSFTGRDKTEIVARTVRRLDQEAALLNELGKL